MSNLKFFLISLILLGGNFLNVTAQSHRGFDVTLTGTSEAPRILACKAPEFSFHLPHMAGNFRLGIANEKSSLWTSDIKKATVKNNKGKLTYTLKDSMLGDGSLTVRAVSLTDSDGVVLEVEANNIPEQIRLMWSFGGCYGEILDHFDRSHLEPLYCKYNVFSVEGSAFTVYYGESMKLKIIQGIAPLNSDIRLSDAHQQQTPLDFYESGKQTDAPALTAAVPLTNHQKLYFCIYKQNRKADYNYYMLPELFEKEFHKK